MTAGTLISGQSRGDGLDLAAAGSWTAEHAGTLEPQVDAATRTNSQVRKIAIDVARIDRLDTFGAWLLERAMRTWTSQGDLLRAADRSAGAKPVVRAHASARGDVEVADEGAFVDVDTPEDYERFFTRSDARRL